MARQLSIDLELAGMAFEDRDGGGSWFLDAETGEVVRQGGELRIAIPSLGPEVGRRDRADFIASVSDHQLRARLAAATGPLENVLEKHPDELERWLAFQAVCLRRRIGRWLASEGIEWVPRPPAS